jgi:hypothetical protein
MTSWQSGFGLMDRPSADDIRTDERDPARLKTLATASANEDEAKLISYDVYYADGRTLHFLCVIEAPSQEVAKQLDCGRQPVAISAPSWPRTASSWPRFP